MELAAKAVALGASLSLVASLIYDWGFFSALDLTFLEVPSTLSDHVRSALIWFPRIAASIGAIAVFEILTKRIEQGMTEEEIVQSSSNPKLIRKLRDGPLWFMGYASALVVAGYLLIGAPFLQMLPLSLCVLWFLFSMWAQSHHRIISRRPSLVRVAVHFLPPILIWLYFAGYTEAARLYGTDAPKSKLATNAVASESVTLLRYLERGVLVKDATNVVSFHPWSEIKKIEAPGRYTPAKGVLCVWFGVGCLPPSSTKQ